MKDAQVAPDAAGGGLARFVPALGWLRGYERAWLVPDLVAGLTRAAYVIPAGIADASLAQLPPQAGLYACLFSGLVFWFLCSSRHTAVTVTSAISLLVGATLGELGNGDPARIAALAACTALLSALLALLVWLFRGGSVVNFVSETVLLGFKAGVALYLASTQLPKLFGIAGAHGDFWERMHYLLAHLGETHQAALLLGLAALALLVLGKRFLPNRPVSLFVVVGGIAAAGWLDLGAHGVKLLGEVPQGLPLPALPAVAWSDLNELLPLAMACFLLAAVETSAIGRMFGQKHGYRVDTNQEFLALAGANLAVGLGQGFPVSGGMSQSVVNESSGARTPLSVLVSSLLILFVVLFLSGLLRDLPQPVLAALVLVAVTGLFKVDALGRLWHFSRAEFAIAMAALFTAYHLGCKAIIALTESGSTALWMSRHKIHVPIFALTAQPISLRKMALYRNVRPLLIPSYSDRDEALKHAEALLVEHGVLRPGDTYAITCGEPMGHPGGTNMLKVCEVR